MKSGAMVATVVLGASALGYGVSQASAGSTAGSERGSETTAAATAAPAAAPTASTAPSTPPATVPAASPTVAAATAVATPKPTPEPTPKPKPKPKPVLTPGPRLLGPGDKGPKVRELQSRLRSIAWMSGNVTDLYGDQTETAVRGFQAKRGIPVTGYVDQRTLDRLHAMSRQPSADELANRFPSSSSTKAALDPRCTTGRALCIDKSSRTVRWVVDGNVQKTMDVRFGASSTPTREGQYSVGWKDREHHSKLYDSPMPYAMFFSGGQAVHYSSDFAARGYSGASHGCVNVRDRAGISWLYDQVAVGDKVIVYWS